MPTHTSLYYVGRLNLVSAYHDEKKTFLLNGLNSHTALPVKTYEYGFFTVEEVQYDGEEYLSGFLVKYRPSEPTEVVDTATREIEDSEFRDKVRAKSRFFLHIKTGIIIYQVFGEFNERSFKKNFCDLLERAYDNFFVQAEIQTINEEVSFFESVDRLDAISKVIIYLHPSNPSSREIWRKQDERLQDLKIESYTEIYKFKSSSNGAIAKEDQEIGSKLHMASDGYGKAKIIGKVDGETKVVSTGDNPVVCSVETEADEEPSARDIMAQVIPTFKSIFKRMKDAL